jgi:hypothetical protein
MTLAHQKTILKNVRMRDALFHKKLFFYIYEHAYFASTVYIFAFFSRAQACRRAEIHTEYPLPPDKPPTPVGPRGTTSLLPNHAQKGIMPE